VQKLVADVTAELDGYDPYDAAHMLNAFIEELSNWYVRRSRRRFWRPTQAVGGQDDADKDAAYSTLYAVLTTLCKLLAPFTPFVVETMYQNLVKSVDADAPASVHHQDWPVADKDLLDENLLSEMDMAIHVASLGRSARNSSNVKLRQPLAKAIVVADARQQVRLERLADIVLDELNVQELAFLRQASDLVHYEINLLPQFLGKKHGRLFPKLRKAVAAMDAAPLAHALQAGQSFTVDVEGTVIEVLPEEAEVRMRAREGLAVAEGAGIVVGIDTELTPELVQAGLARDIVRRVQDARKNAGFEIEDRIVLTYQAGEALGSVFEAQREYIAGETLADEIRAAAPVPESHVESFVLDGQEATVSVTRVS
jgi:isoleucyl-tRNA synthetase